MSSTVESTKIQANRVVTDELQIGDSIIRNVLAKEFENCDPMSLITKGYLDHVLYKIESVIQKFDPSGKIFREISMISLSLVNPYFDVPEEWILDNWFIQDNVCKYHGSMKENELTIPNSVYINNGNYLLCFTIDSIPSGKLELLVNGEWKYTFDKPGVYYREVQINSFTDDKVSLVAKNVNDTDEIHIGVFSIHFVADRFYDFLVEKIRSLAVVDATNFVPREEFTNTLESFIVQFKEATDRYLEVYAGHMDAVNPHGITYELLGAAAKKHTHDEYFTKAQLTDAVAAQMKDYSKVDHGHSEYVEAKAIKNMVEEILSNYLTQIISVDSMILTEVPTARMPSRFAQTDVSAPVSLILPSRTYHNGKTSYDWIYGIASTSNSLMMNETPKIFAGNADSFGTVPSSLNENLSFRYTFNNTVTLKGYRILVKNALIEEWSVYSGDVTFVHKIMGSKEFSDNGNGIDVAELLFDEPTSMTSITFTLEKYASKTEDPWELRLEFIPEHMNPNAFYINKESFKFCVPTKGTNRVVVATETVEDTEIVPSKIVDDTSLYVFGRQEFTETGVSFGYSYYPPEYSNVRKGLDIFTDKFLNIELASDSVREKYVHPAYGELYLKTGMSADGFFLKDIYKNDETGWRSSVGDSRVTIEQTIDSDNVVMTGYLMSWRLKDADSIPKSWTLTLEGFDADNKPVSTVVDSVDRYYSYYSVEDDDFVYHKKIVAPMTVKKLILTIDCRDGADFISLNRFVPFFSERWYSIPQNVMYCGLKESSEMCLGSVIHRGQEIGWVPTNICCGKSCVIPVNDLEMCSLFTDYVIPNPFFSTDVVTSVNSYSLKQNESTSPSAYITLVNEREIHVRVEAPFRYAVFVSRSW